jgi:hypothetical protein
MIQPTIVTFKTYYPWKILNSKEKTKDWNAQLDQKDMKLFWSIKAVKMRIKKNMY